MKKMLLVVCCMIILAEPVLARRGCCSHHGGVSGGCSGGRQVCNDGTISPSCACESYNTPRYIYGCTDSNAKNYNSRANYNNGSCEYYKYGCTDINAYNYDSSAELDDGSCIEKVYGCMDSTAINYNENANTDDECIYEEKTQEVASSKLSKQKDDENAEDSAASGILTIVAAVVFSYWKFRK